ncbi:MAG TPA: hypothetical protein VMH04_07550 [Candidatus Solibacter sp.]|nr:hypothetical protein [Candidatus Solibacter sp.]
MDTLTSIATLGLTLSIAVERVLEILKGFIPALSTPRVALKAEYIRVAILHFLSVSIGSIASGLGHVDLFQRVGGAQAQASGTLSLYTGYIICGLLAAGGSAFWNHLLDIIKAVKIKDESGAKKAAADVGNNNPIA